MPGRAGALGDLPSCRRGDSVMITAAPAAVVTLGETMASFVAREHGPMAETADFRRTVAGAEANVAAGLARLGVPVAYIGRVGADGLGTSVIRSLRGQGVDVGYLQTDPAAPTGVMIRERRDVGPAEVVYWRSGSAGSRLSPEDVTAATGVFQTARWLHVSGVTPALSPTAAAAVTAAVELAGEHGLRISLDVNLRRRLWSEDRARAVLAPLAARCDVVLGSRDELAVIGGLAGTAEDGHDADPSAAADAVLALGPAIVVVKLGVDGALERRRRDGQVSTTSDDGFPVGNVRDPIGAGDAFTAGYIAASLEGQPVAQVLRAANACGAAAVASLGDQTGLLTRSELDRLLGGRSGDTLR